MSVKYRKLIDAEIGVAVSFKSHPIGFVDGKVELVLTPSTKLVVMVSGEMVDFDEWVDSIRNAERQLGGNVDMFK